MPFTSKNRTFSENPMDRFQYRWLNALIWIAFSTLAIWGCWASIDIGIGWDEEAERATLLINLSAIKGLLQGSMLEYESLLAHSDRYYGIGFHLPAYALTHLLQSAQAVFSTTANTIHSLILTHLFAWLCFLASALLVRTLLLRLLTNTLMANIGMLVFAFWPYLLGHGLMNIKDMPFVFAWLLCTVVALPIVQIPQPKEDKPLRPSTGSTLLLAIATAWLLSIRISGVLIFAQYGCMLLSHWYFSHARSGQHPLTVSSILKFFVPQVAIFIPAFMIFLILFYPVAWHNPIELINAINYMSHHPWDGTTLTAGRFIAPGSKLNLYISVWLLAKLPLIALIGLILSPWAVYRQYQQLQYSSQEERNSIALWMGLASGALVIIFALIIMRVGLYNELRQTLFLFPLLFIIGISSLYFLSRKLKLVGLLLTFAVSIWDNLTLYPYNYSYLNEIARQRLSMQYFETDYFGFSAGRSARWLSNQSQYSEAECIYAYPTHLLSYEINTKLYPCLKTSDGYGRNLPADRPSPLHITQRNLINFAIPEQCTLINSEERTLPLSRQPLIMGQLFNCKPGQ